MESECDIVGIQAADRVYNKPSFMLRKIKLSNVVGNYFMGPEDLMWSKFVINFMYK